MVDLRARASAWALPPEGAERLRAAKPAGWEIRFIDAPTVSDGDGGASPSVEARDAVAEAEATLAADEDEGAAWAATGADAP